MEEKINFIRKIKSDPNTYLRVQQRIAEFESFKDKPNSAWFSELCFCLMTANASARGGIAAQKAVREEGFLNLSQEELAKKLVEVKYRFPFVRSKYIVEARRHSNIKEIIQKMPSREAREWLVKNIKGLGMKEASHFLRNVGRKDLAILDKHIIRSLGLEVKPLKKETYEEIEKKLFEIGKITNTDMAELDLILWYGQTGEILK